MSSWLVSALLPVMRVNAGPGREQQEPEFCIPLGTKGGMYCNKRRPVFGLVEREIELLYIYVGLIWEGPSIPHLLILIIARLRSIYLF